MKQLFIGGCGRSGSSLLQDLLTRHPKIAGGPEFNFTRSIMELHSQMATPFFLQRNTPFYTKDSLDKRFRSFYLSFFEDFERQHPEAQWVSEKTPENIMVAHDLLTLFPESKFIFVLRDGRDAVASYRDVFRRSPEGVNRKEARIRRLASIWMNALHHRDALPPELHERLITVRYEAFVQDPDKTLERIVKELGLQPSSTPLTRVTTEDRSVHVDEVFHTSEMVNSPPDPSSIGSWKERLSFWERIQVNVLLAHGLDQEGYIAPLWAKTINRILRTLNPRSTT